jgi:hypothetical protein
MTALTAHELEARHHFGAVAPFGSLSDLRALSTKRGHCHRRRVYLV